MPCTHILYCIDSVIHKLYICRLCTSMPCLTFLNLRYRIIVEYFTFLAMYMQYRVELTNQCLHCEDNQYSSPWFDIWGPRLPSMTWFAQYIVCVHDIGCGIHNVFYIPQSYLKWMSNVSEDFYKNSPILIYLISHNGRNMWITSTSHIEVFEHWYSIMRMVKNTWSCNKIQFNYCQGSRVKSTWNLQNNHVLNPLAFYYWRIPSVQNTVYCIPYGRWALVGCYVIK